MDKIAKFSLNQAPYSPSSIFLPHPTTHTTFPLLHLLLSINNHPIFQNQFAQCPILQALVNPAPQLEKETTLPTKRCVRNLCLRLIRWQFS